MTQFNEQKSKKLTLMEVAQNQLSGNMLDEFQVFLEFMKEERLESVWKSINGFNVNYIGKRIFTVTLGAPGWLDNAIERKNYVGINVLSAEFGDEEEYLKAQSEINTALFMEQMSYKCIHCRPTCGCSKRSGRTVRLLGMQHDNICMNAIGYKFYAVGDNIREFIMCTPRAVYPPEEVCPVSMEIVKKLIIARKNYIVK